ncbi:MULTISPECIES: hypothetical protein [unclassified Serratia (in: enterobacteria)]|uniref:hypothetical protein n=1 Tax=unclassified Serratia (in: enterobacteria) TaxID=2647522 RepID=UPI003075FF2B
MKPGKAAIELKMVDEINRLLREQGRSKLWLADEIGLDYGKVKRVLSKTDSQQLSLTVANDMLSALGTNLADAITGGVISSLRHELDRYGNAA